MKPDVSSAIPYDLLMSVQKGTMAYSYRGVPMLKNPFDLALYPLLLAQTKPRTVLEIGSYKGGSALWFSDIGANLGVRPDIYSIDLQPPQDVKAENIHFISGDARALAEALPDSFMPGLQRPLLVIEDADHHHDTTLAVLRFFDRWLQPGEYIVIEDGILADMQVADSYEGGPCSAIDEFLTERGNSYSVDRRFCDFFGRNVTWNVNGYLRRDK